MDNVHIMTDFTFEEFENKKICDTELVYRAFKSRIITREGMAYIRGLI